MIWYDDVVSWFRFKYTSQQFEKFICQIRQLAECNILDSTTFFPFLASLPLPRVSILKLWSDSAAVVLFVYAKYANYANYVN